MNDRQRSVRGGPVRPVCPGAARAAGTATTRTGSRCTATPHSRVRSSSYDAYGQHGRPVRLRAATTRTPASRTAARPRRRSTATSRTAGAAGVRLRPVRQPAGAGQPGYRASSTTRTASRQQPPAAVAAAGVDPAAGPAVTRTSRPRRGSSPATTSPLRSTRTGRPGRRPRAAPRRTTPAAGRRERPAGPGRRPGVPHRAVLLHRGARRGLRRRHRLAEVHREPHRAARGGQAPRPQPHRRAVRRARPARRRRRRLPLVRGQAARPASGPDSAGTAAAAAAQKRDVIVVHLHNTKDGGTLHGAARRQRHHQAGHHRPAAQLPRRLPATTAPARRSASPSRTTAPAAPATPSTPSSAPTSRAPGGWTPPTWRTSSSSVGNIDPRHRRHRARGAKKGAAPLVKQGQGPGPQRPDGRRLRHLPGRRRAPDASSCSGSARSCRRSCEEVSERRRRRHHHRPDAGARSSTRRSPKGQLGSFAGPARRAREGRRRTRPTLLPVQADGTLSAEATRERGQGRARRHGQEAADTDAAARVARPERHRRPGRHRTRPRSRCSTAATPSSTAAPPARPRPRPRSPTRTPPQKAKAAEVAKTLGLPAGAVKKGKGAANADITVVLGQDYKPAARPGRAPDRRGSRA